jgi:DNA-binding CsgD family transcriptional regulator
MAIDVRDRFKLTSEQEDILRRAVQGQTRVAISQELGISRSTVDKQLRLAYGKLGVATRDEAIDLLGLEAPEVLRAWEAGVVSA